MNVVSVNGGKVHSPMPGLADGEEHTYPLCRGGGRNQQLTKFRFVEAELSCKTCMTYAERRKAAEQTEGEIMATNGKLDVTTDEGRKALEQIDANIERAHTLAQDDNPQAVEELGKETEALISALSGKGSIKSKTEKREAWRVAVTEVAERKAASTEVAKPKEYTEYEGVSELVSMGAERVAEGVRLHIKTSTTARGIAEIILDMWRRIEDKEGNPDIAGKSDAAKKASSALYRAAGEALRGEDTYDVETAVKSLMRSVQTQRTDVRAKYLRSLDEDTAEAAEERAHFAKLLESKPEGTPVSEFVAAHYGVGLKGELEKARERSEEQRKALEAQREDNGGDAGASDKPVDPEAEIRAAIKAIRRDVTRIDADTFGSTFEALPEGAQEEVKNELEALLDALKAMIKATI